MNGYIQSLCVKPFQASFYLEKQLDIYMDKCKSKKEASVVHFDSTGNIIQKVKDQKRPYLYTLLLDPIGLPVMEFITCDHHSFNLRSQLDSFQSKIRKLNNNVNINPTMVVTDYSFALINAVSESFNRMNIIDYLGFAFNMLTSTKITKNSIKNVSFISLCSAHMIKSVSRR